MGLTHGFEEMAYLTPTIRDYLKNREKTFAEDDSFFTKIAPQEKMVAYRNNYQAYRYAVGNVPELHNTMLSSKVVSTIHKKLLSKIVNNVSVEGESDEAKALLMSSIVDFPKKIRQAVSHALLRGEAVLTIDKLGDNKVAIQIYPLARYDLMVNANGEIIEAKLYKQLIDGDNKFIKYLLAEHRGKTSGGYYSEYTLTRYEASTIIGNDKYEAHQLEENDIPPSIKRQLGDIELNKKRQLTCLGVYRLANTHDNLLCPNSDVGESQYLDAIDDIVVYETSYTFREVDKNIGRGRVLMPSIGKMFDSSIRETKTLNGSIKRLAPTSYMDYTFISPYENYGEKGVPQSIQFALRTEEWSKDMADCLSRICTKCGLSVYDYDPTLFGGVRTAREIDELSDLTKATVKEKHSIYTDTLNSLLKDCALLLGLSDIDVFIKWDKSTTENAAANNEIVLARYNARLCSAKTAIMNLNPNWSEAEVEAELERIESETDSKDADALFEAI